MEISTTIIGSLAVSLITTALTLIFWLGKYQERFDRLKKDTANIEYKDIKELKEKIAKQAEEIVEIKAIIQQSGLLNGTYISSSSPLQLTDDGEKVLNESGLKKIIDANEEKLYQALLLESHETPYDIQEAAVKLFTKDFINNDLFNATKDYAFNNGKNFLSIMYTGGIYFRNKALKKLGYNLHDLDIRNAQ